MIGFKIETLTRKVLSDKVAFFLFFMPVSIIFMYAVYKIHILPDRFFYDEGVLYWFMLMDPSFSLGDSYKSTAAFFNILGFERGSYTLSVLSFIFIYLTLSSHIRRSGLKSIDLIEYLLFLFLFFLMSTYMTMLSKELIVLLLMMPFVFFATKGYKGLLVWTFFAFVYAAYFRNYWFIVIGFFWVVFFVMRFFNKRIILYSIVPILLMVLSILFYTFLGIDLDYFRTSVNDYRLSSLDQDARTIILPFLAGSGPVVSWVNSIITWLFLMLPVPLYLLMAPYYFVNALLITFLFFKAFLAIKIEYENKLSIELRAVSSIIIAFISVQAIFEPDYGSYVKHLTPMYPLFFYLILKSRNMKLNNKA